jgi:hypothetical protein
VRSLKRIALQALFFSLLAHLILLNLFSFRLPLKNAPLKPFVNFLGSFLASYDTQGAKKSPPELNLQKGSVVELSTQQTGNSHVTVETPRALLFLSLPTSTKKTLPNVKVETLPVLEDLEPKQQDEEESFQYAPLKLPEHDRY